MSSHRLMVSSLTTSSINAISKVIADKMRDEVFEQISNKIRSEFKDISDPLVYKITLETLKKLTISN